MKTFTDEMLVSLCASGDENAIEVLFSRYKPYLQKITRGYFLLGADQDDLLQEAMIGLYKAILSYNPEKEASFKTFANMCVRRNVLTAIKKSNTQKNKVLNDSLSLSGFSTENDEDETLLFLPFLAQNTDDLIIEEENFKEIKKQIVEKLSTLELKILKLYLKGYSYQLIASNLEISEKSVDNALTRIKTKLHYLHNK